MREKIAICITTRNRPKAFDTCLREWMVMVPWTGDVNYFVVDDASDALYCNPSHRFDTRVGIPRAKNKCLELAMDWDADHIFLADDDVYPISRDALLPYIKSGQHHLCYTFLHSVGIVGDFKIHTLGNGCMMYFSRHCIEKVGGFDTDFGYGKFEHTELSGRIHNAGLTPYVFMDVLGSDKLYHSMDEHAEVLRTMTNKEMDVQMKRNAPLFNAKRNDALFKPYK